MKKIIACLLIVLCICGCSKVQESTNPVLGEADNSSEIIYEGRYVDDLNTGYEKSEMIITKRENGDYVINFGIYKLFYISEAIGEYHTDTNELTFEGIDDTENEFAAIIHSEGEYLSVKIMKTTYGHFPVGTILKYYPEGHYPVEEYLK